MWLPYGVDPRGEFVHIEDVPRGKTTLGCPYCGGVLSARKGRMKAHHFAHTETTCRAVDRREVPTLPFYDRFDLGLSARAIKALHDQWARYGQHGRSVDSYGKLDNPRAYAELRRAGCFEYHAYYGRSGGRLFTNLGKIPVGALSMRLFAEFQQEHLLLKLIHLEQLHRAASEVDKETAATDLRLYQDQYHRVLASTLCLLEIKAEGLTLHKIGVTRREVEERLAEIERDLAAHFTSFKAKVVDTWAHRGAVEFYFKYRYRHCRYELGSLTEYFQFETPGLVTRDLRRMKPIEWDEKELDILNQRYLDPHPRSSAVRAGMRRAAARGVHIGRPKGAESAEVFLGKAPSQRVIAALAQNLSLRQVARVAGVSVGTVRKVKALLQESHTEDLTS